MLTNRPATVGLLLCALSWAPPPARAAEIKVLCSNGLRAVMLDLGPAFEQRSGDTVKVDFAPAAVLTQRIASGEAFDVAVLTPEAIDDGIGRGRLAASPRVVVAQSALGLAMRAGADRPVLDSIPALTRALRAATSITYATQGASAAPFRAIVERLGLTSELEPKYRLRETGAQVGEAVSSGAVQLGVIPVSEILPIPGVELAGRFPEAAQSYLLMVAAVATSSRESREAAALVEFLASPAHAPLLRRKGMEPGAGRW